MHLRKHHVCLSRRRGGVLYFQSISSLDPPYNKLPFSDGSINTRSLLLQISEYMGALHLHSRPASSVLPSIEHVSHNIGSRNCNIGSRTLQNGRKGKAPCVTEDSGTRVIYPYHSIISPSANQMGIGDRHLGHHISKDETALHLHRNNVEATLSILEHVKEDMGAAGTPQKNGKNKPAFHQTDEFLLNMGDEDWGALLLQHSIPPASFCSIVNSLPRCRRTKVHFRNIISLIVLLQTMDINTDTFPPVYVRKAPFMYQRDPVIHLQPKIVYLEKLGMHRTEMQRLVLKYPYALYPPIEDIQAQILFLRSFPLQHEDVLRILRKTPTVFLLPADKYIQPKIEFFRNMGIPQRFIREMMLLYPRIFCRPLSNLQKIVVFLQGLGVVTPSSRVLCIAGYMNLERLQVIVKTLSDVGFSMEDIQVLIKRAPGILTENPQYMTSKLDYLVNVMKRCPREIMKYPAYLASCSLDKRIRPRHEALVQWAAEKQVNKHFRLSYILIPSDKVFFSQFPGICRILTSKTSSQ